MRLRSIRDEDIFVHFEIKTEWKISELAAAMGFALDTKPQKRLLQKALQNLVKRGLLETRGETRSRVYLKPGAPKPVIAAPFPAAIAPPQIPCSPEAQKLRAYLDQEPRFRMPAGYEPSFLGNYRPNQDHYLDAKSRKRLWALGTSGALARPAGTYARQIYQRLLIDLAWNSSRLEGNTYTLLQTKRLLEAGAAASGKQAEETQMLLNHKAAIGFVVNDLEEIEITKFVICNIHSYLSENLLGTPEACGQIRFVPVSIGESTYVPLESHIDLVRQMDLFVQKVKAIEDPFEQSIFSLVQLSYLQAFEDVNKRTSRLAANIPLIKANLKPLSFTDVPEEEYLKSLLGVYEKNDVSLLRDLYLWAYERSALRYTAVQQSMGAANLLKLKFGEKIQEIVRSIVLAQTPKDRVVQEISAQLKYLPLDTTQAKDLTHLLELEIAGLHEGNLAKYQLTPEQLRIWGKGK